MEILLIVYWIAGYWATGQTIFANKIIIHQFGELFIQRLILGLILGWALIPIAILKNVFSK